MMIHQAIIGALALYFSLACANFGRAKTEFPNQKFQFVLIIHVIYITDPISRMIAGCHVMILPRSPGR